MAAMSASEGDTATNQPRLLACLAHPDDESFGPGGTLALYSSRGVEVHLVCATNGDVGTVDPEYLRGFENIAALRQAELDCAVQALGIHELHMLGYRDSGMPGSEENKHRDALAAAPLSEVVDRLVQIIREVRPQVVLTFDPIGGYFHPDHIRMHEATVEAFHAASDPSRLPDATPVYRPQKLYYHTFSRRWLKVAVRIMPLLGRDPTRWGRNDDIDLTEVSKHDFDIHASIDVTEALEAKEMAAACHASQREDADSRGGLLTWIRDALNQRENFSRAFPPADDGLQEEDLFEGVDLET